MSEEHRPSRRWTLKTVVGTIFLIMGLLVCLGSRERERAGFYPTNIYTYGNGIGFLVAGTAMLCWGMLTGRKQ
jgi:hypothetical protein